MCVCHNMRSPQGCTHKDNGACTPAGLPTCAVLPHSSQFLLRSSVLLALSACSAQQPLCSPTGMATLFNIYVRVAVLAIGASLTQYLHPLFHNNQSELHSTRHQACLQRLLGLMLAGTMPPRHSQQDSPIAATPTPTDSDQTLCAWPVLTNRQMHHCCSLYRLFGHSPPARASAWGRRPSWKSQ